LLLATARCNPEFAARLLRNLPEPARAELLAELSKPVTRRVAPGPGLAKCGPLRTPNNGLSAQLNLFAKSVARVS
jgi:hypothetical protein